MLTQQKYVTENQAREIMGSSIFGSAEIALCFKKKLPPWKIPFSETTLERHKDTHILTAVLPRSIQGMRKRFPIGSMVADGARKILRASAPIGWHLVRMDHLPCSLGQSWTSQKSILGPEEQVACAPLMVYIIACHHFISGERLLERTSVRCAEPHLVVGFYNTSQGWTIYVEERLNKGDLGVGIATSVRY